MTRLLISLAALSMLVVLPGCEVARGTGQIAKGVGTATYGAGRVVYGTGRAVAGGVRAVVPGGGEGPGE